MTTRTVLRRDEPEFVWLDLVQPSPEELGEVAEEYGLHSTSVKDCLDPEHLPKHEPFDTHTFVIIRAFDEEADRAGDTVQELTRKLAIFYGPGFVITIHRKAQPWLTALERRMEAIKPSPGKEGLQAQLLTHLLNGALDTYLGPLEAIVARLDTFEAKAFAAPIAAGAVFREELREIYVIKHQITLCKRLLWRIMDVAQRMTPASGRAAIVFRDVQENAESFHFYADELLDDANTLLNVQLALASHRTAEVMRVLTVFSVFFLPLTFIVGVYGMNFDLMPELRQWWGYPAVLLGMVAVTLIIYRWFRRRGWLRE